MAANDFDFLFGTWRVRHRRLVRRLAGCSDWAHFDGTLDARPVLGGRGNVDENVIDAPDGRYEACTIRLFDSEAGTWSIHWVDGRFGRLDPPLIGRFEEEVGTFYGDDRFEGRPIGVRFFWTPSPARPRWEQAFSDDGGATWETNWIMDFARA